MLARTFRQMLVILEKNVRDQRAIWQALWQGFRIPPFAADDLIRQARRYKSRRDLTRALRLIARADLELRSSPPRQAPGAGKAGLRPGLRSPNPSPHSSPPALLRSVRPGRRAARYAIPRSFSHDAILAVDFFDVAHIPVAQKQQHRPHMNFVVVLGCAAPLPRSAPAGC